MSDGSRAEGGRRSDEDPSGHHHARRRYLTAKRSVDDRARDRRVRERLLRALPDHPHVVEAGCGAGLSVPTLYEWGVTPASYRGVDTDTGIVPFARHLVSRVLRRRGYEAVGTTEGCRVEGVEVVFEIGDALRRLPSAGPEAASEPGESDAGLGADLLLAQSFLDLVPLDSALDAAEHALSPDGLAYAPVTFDGVTAFLPGHPADERVIEAFHRDIDSTPGRDVRAGRHLLERLGERGDRIHAVGASNWIVRPVDGRYPADERYFLACILRFVADALDDVEGGPEWLETRRRQLRAGELTYVAHNYDVLWSPRG
ncbi:SAM-dependent methyltransferase [Salinirubellus sp. GCM10025818]|uniref:SAM-dependent methyltransferase n=1 Tax=Salinirubellus TaxID=2162630 RepID=UPI0030D53E3C